MACCRSGVMAIKFRQWPQSLSACAHAESLEQQSLTFFLCISQCAMDLSALYFSALWAACNVVGASTWRATRAALLSDITNDVAKVT